MSTAQGAPKCPPHSLNGWGPPHTLKNTLITEVYVTSGEVPLVSGPVRVIPFTGNELELFLGFNGETNLAVVSLLNCSLLP